MNQKDIHKLVSYVEDEVIFIPNEIFDDFILHITSRPHIPVAYAFYYLISYLYRYTKYGSYPYKIDDIKEILGFNAKYKKVDYIIKKNGLLDQIGYTYSSTNYPISWIFNEGYIEFDMFSDLDSETRKYIATQQGKNYKIKIPLKGLHRTKESEEDNCEDGTFFEIDNTHKIPFEVFTFCMANKDIGCTGFYIYSYIKYKNQMFPHGYDVSLFDLSEETGIGERTLDKYLWILKSHRMIECYHNQEFFSLALPKSERKANSYIAKDYVFFSDEEVPVSNIKKLSVKEYNEKYNKQEDKPSWGICDDELPF